jgi:hypothetical protein
MLQVLDSSGSAALHSSLSAKYARVASTTGLWPGLARSSTLAFLSSSKLLNWLRNLIRLAALITAASSRWAGSTAEKMGVSSMIKLPARMSVVAIATFPWFSLSINAYIVNWIVLLKVSLRENYDWCGVTSSRCERVLVQPSPLLIFTVS